MFNKIRSLMPYLVAAIRLLAPGGGKITPYMDNRLVYYRQNQVAIPDICHGILRRSWRRWTIM